MRPLRTPPTLLPRLPFASETDASGDPEREPEPEPDEGEEAVDGDGYQVRHTHTHTHTHTLGLPGACLGPECVGPLRLAVDDALVPVPVPAVCVGCVGIHVCVYVCACVYVCLFVCVCVCAC